MYYLGIEKTYSGISINYLHFWPGILSNEIKDINRQTSKKLKKAIGKQSPRKNGTQVISCFFAGKNCYKNTDITYVGHNLEKLEFTLFRDIVLTCFLTKRYRKRDTMAIRFNYLLQ